MIGPITAGMKVLAFGDSISDPFYYGQYVDRFCTATGTVKINGNLIPNGNFEPNLGVLAWVAPSAFCTLTTSTAQHKFGAQSMIVQPTAAGQANNAAWAAPGGDTGAKQLGMQLGRQYTYSAWVFVPTGTLGTIQLTITDNDGTGYVVSSSSAAVANSTWQLLSVSRTLRTYSGSGTEEAFCRVLWSGSAGQVDSTKFIYVDGVELDTGLWSGTQLPPYVGDTASRSAIAGTLLTNAHGDVNNGLDTFATRVIGTPDVVIVEYGINDWFNSNADGLTADNWRQAVHVTLAKLQALSPAPQIVWMGLTQTITTAPSPPSTGWTGYDTSTRTTFKAAMNLIARQECALYQVPFVTLAELMSTSLVQVNAPFELGGGADGIHPTQTGGADGHNYLLTALQTQIGRAVGPAAPADDVSYLVEMCLSATPTTFATVPSRMVSCKIKRGRDDELTGPMQTGTATLVLDNRDGAFSPDNAASPYAGFLLPGRRVRISARLDPAAAWTPLYYGYIDSIRPEDNGPADSNVTIQCIDWLGRMNAKGTINGTVTSGGYGPHDLINWFASLMGIVDSTATFTIVNPTDGTSQNLIDFALVDANALTAVTDFATTVRGVVFAGADGTIRATANGGTATTTQFDNYLLFDQPGLNLAANVVPYTAVDYDLTTTFLYNDITITAPAIGGGTQNVQDSASITAYDKRSLAYSFAYMGLDQALPYAYKLLAAYRNPHPRVHALTIDVDGAAGVTQNGLNGADLLFALELTAPVTMAKQTPGTLGINRRMVVEGIAHDIKPDRGGTGAMHEVTLQLAEYTEILPGWRLNVSKLGTETALNYAPGIFNPLNLSAGCLLWLRGDRGVTLSGGNLASWADQSGNGVTASPSGGTAPVSSGGITLHGGGAGHVWLNLSSDVFTNGGVWSAYIVATLPVLSGTDVLLQSTGRAAGFGTGSISIESFGGAYEVVQFDGSHTLTVNDSFGRGNTAIFSAKTADVAGVFTATAFINNDGGTAATAGTFSGSTGGSSEIGDSANQDTITVFEVLTFVNPLTPTEHAYILDNLNRKYFIY